MTLRELLDAETLERVRKYDKERKRRARDAGKHPCACGCGALVYQESVWARGHFDRHRKRTREEERDRLLLDMADALRPLVTEDSFVYDGGNTRDDIRELLARLDRISTQTSEQTAEGDAQHGSAHPHHRDDAVATGHGPAMAGTRPSAVCSPSCDPGDCGEDCDLEGAA